MRELENAPGFTYDADDTYKLFAEDWNDLKAFLDSITPITNMFSFVGGAIIQTNITSGIQWWGGDATSGGEARSRFFDLSKKTKVRLIVYVNTTGNSGSKILVRGRTAGYSGTASNYAAILPSSADLYCSLSGGTGFVDTGWLDLDDSFKGFYSIGLFSIGGNGTADPSITQATLYFQ